MMDIYGNQGSVYLTDTKAWDEYLSDGIAVMATATPNVHSPTGVNRMNSEGFAIYAYSDSSNTNTILEKIAMGRSYIASVKVGGGSLNNTPMNLYFAALGDKVPMGRYPVVVDSQTSKTGKLHAVVTNVPSSANYKLVLKSNGGANVGSSIAIPSGTSLFEHEYNLSLGTIPNGSFKYYRYEVQDSQGNPVAFSQPILYQKTSSAIYPGFWTALVPKASAALDLPADSVTFSSGVLLQKIGARLVQGEGQVATVKTYMPKGMFSNDSFSVKIDSAGSGLAWQFSASSRILTANFTVIGPDDVTLEIKHAG
jgi:hypothetical protein